MCCLGRERRCAVALDCRDKPGNDGQEAGKPGNDE